MIRLLRIRQFALIDSLDIEFEPGLNVVTGETGAGKSIVIDAISLLLGERASADLVRTGADVAIIEAELGGPNDDTVIVRRELTPQGRSRAFLDDQLVTTSGLRSRMVDLIDLHGQHEHQRLLLGGVQLDLLDAFGDLSTLREATASAFADFRRLTDELNTMRAGVSQRTDRLQHLSFERAEIDKVGPRAGEDDDLSEQRRVLAHAERIQRLAAEAYDLLHESDGSVRSTLRQIWRRVEELASLDSRLVPQAEGRAAVDATLDDLANVLREYANPADDPETRLEEIEHRLAQLERLKRRHGMSLAGVLALRSTLEADIAQLGATDDRTRDLEQRCVSARARFAECAGRLSATRRLTAEKLCRALEHELKSLAMPRTRCEFRLHSVVDDESRWSRTGIDIGELYISPNPGEDLRPLARIASGGELSRLTLAVFSVTGGRDLASTLIFDEVDAGIGGETADAVGARLSRLACKAQVLCVTHLPQVAAHGSTHFRVIKESRGSRTMTHVAKLAASDRIDELARMMAGGGSSATIRAAAAELLTNRRKTIASGAPTPRAPRDSNSPKSKGS